MRRHKDSRRHRLNSWVWTRARLRNVRSTFWWVQVRRGVAALTSPDDETWRGDSKALLIKWGTVDATAYLKPNLDPHFGEFNFMRQHFTGVNIGIMPFFKGLLKFMKLEGREGCSIASLLFARNRTQTSITAFSTRCFFFLFETAIRSNF